MQRQPLGHQRSRLPGANWPRSRRRYSYRFLYLPGTIGRHHLAERATGRTGSIRSRLRADLRRRPRPVHTTRKAAAATPRSTGRCRTSCGTGAAARDPRIRPYGYDERQFCSPGFNLPVGCLMRTPHGEYPEYHTSADDWTSLASAALAESLHTCLAIDVLGAQPVLPESQSYGEPALGRRGRTDRAGAVPWTSRISPGCGCSASRRAPRSSTSRIGLTGFRVDSQRRHRAPGSRSPRRDNRRLTHGPQAPEGATSTSHLRVIFLRR